MVVVLVKASSVAVVFKWPLNLYTLWLQITADFTTHMIIIGQATLLPLRNSHIRWVTGDLNYIDQSKWSLHNFSSLIGQAAMLPQFPHPNGDSYTT